MNGNVVVTGADRGLGLAVASQLAEAGWRVFAGQFKPDWPELGEAEARLSGLTAVPMDVQSQDSVVKSVERVRDQVDRIDVLINNAGVNSLSRTQTIRDGLDYDELHRLYNTNSVGPLRVVEAYLPLMEKSEMKRLCFVSSEAGSVKNAHRDAWYSYGMSKSALNMGVKILFNYLRSDGYTFRLFHPGGIQSYIGGTDTKGQPKSREAAEAAVPAIEYFLRNVENEDELVLRDWKGEVLPW
jgi:NAD(P)-dependent dehydrogenase (short-subunit alcohol dehydrogenase family)